MGGSKMKSMRREEERENVEELGGACGDAETPPSPPVSPLPRQAGLQVCAHNDTGPWEGWSPAGPGAALVVSAPLFTLIILLECSALTPWGSSSHRPP